MTAVHRPALPTKSEHGAVQAPRGTARFAAEALRAPHQIGAIAQSGPRLAAQAAGLLAPHGGPQTVVELGPGAGAISDMLREHLPPASRLLGVEINTAMVEHLSQTRPWFDVIHGDAADLPALLRAAELPPADLIVSALPWSVIDATTQQRILRAITEAMDPNGTFATVATLPARVLPSARRFRRRLHETFGSVSQTRTVWRNIPPARFYICRGPFRPALDRTAPSPSNRSGPGAGQPNRRIAITRTMTTTVVELIAAGMWAREPASSLPPSTSSRGPPDAVRRAGGQVLGHRWTTADYRGQLSLSTVSLDRRCRQSRRVAGIT